MKIYLANSLFSDADRNYNELLANLVRIKFEDIDLYVPQENMGINDKSNIATSQDIAKADVEKLKECDLVIAVLDGVEIDSGVACEVGIAYSLGIPVLGLLTDIRFNNSNLSSKMEIIEEDVYENSIMYRNLFVVGIIKENGRICPRIESLFNEIRWYDRVSKNICPF